jgi:hypothetical protein
LLSVSRRGRDFFPGLVLVLLGALALAEGGEGLYSEITSGDWANMLALGLLLPAGGAALAGGLWLLLPRLRGRG